MSSLLFEAFTPQLPLGDWQIVVAVHSGKGRIAVERWHSSDEREGRCHHHQRKLYIPTGIRAFRRQMPILAGALENIEIAGQEAEQVVVAVFDTLSRIYGASCAAVQFINGGQDDSGTELSDFLSRKKQQALRDLGLAQR